MAGSPAMICHNVAQAAPEAFATAVLEVGGRGT
jgi:hypothetical protein